MQSGCNTFRIGARAWRQLVMAVMLWPGLLYASELSIEYQVKASLIYNFMHFVEWPEPEDAPRDELRLCFIGPKGYARALEQINGKVVRGKALEVRRGEALEEMMVGRECQAIIAGSRESREIHKILDGSSGKHILTIGETGSFLQDGGMIKFTIVNDTVQFEINLPAVEQAGLQISAKMLRLAKAVIAQP